MPDSPWASFEAKVQEGDTLPPLALGDREFSFPASPPASLFFKLRKYEREHGHPMGDVEAVEEMLPEILGEAEFEEFLRRLSMTQLANFVVALFTAWGWYSKDTEAVEVPNPPARPRSTSRSTRGSARSKQTSKATTAST